MIRQIDWRWSGKWSANKGAEEPASRADTTAGPQCDQTGELSDTTAGLQCGQTPQLACSVARHHSWPAVWPDTTAGPQCGQTPQLARSVARHHSWPAVWPDTTAGPQCGQTGVLPGLRDFPGKENPEQHSADLLKEKKNSPREWTVG